MSPYVQLGPGWRPNYALGRLRRRRPARWSLPATLGLAAAIFAAGLLVGRVENKVAPHAAGGPQPLQYYTR